MSEKQTFTFISEDMMGQLEQLLALSKELVAQGANHVGANDLPYMPEQEVSEKLDVSCKTLSRWRNDKKIGYTKANGKIWYSKDDVDTFMQRHHIPAKASGLMSA